MADTLDPKHLDKRTAERYLRSGQLDDKAYERHLKSLPDVADKASTIETAMEDEDFDDDFDENEDENEDEGADTDADKDKDKVLDGGEEDADKGSEDPEAP